MPAQHPTRFMLSEWLSLEVVVDNGKVTATFVERQNPASLNERCVLNIVTTELSRAPVIDGTFVTPQQLEVAQRYAGA